MYKLLWLLVICYLPIICNGVEVLITGIDEPCGTGVPFVTQLATAAAPETKPDKLQSVLEVLRINKRLCFLGLSDYRVRDDQLAAPAYSTPTNDIHKEQVSAKWGRLLVPDLKHYYGGWRSDSGLAKNLQKFTITLDEFVKVHGVAVQLFDDETGKLVLEKFAVSYHKPGSIKDEKVQDDKGQPAEFDGPKSDAQVPVYRYFHQPVTSNKFVIHITAGEPAGKFELLIC